jgi:hypothetical protein
MKEYIIWHVFGMLEEARMSYYTVRTACSVTHDETGKLSRRKGGKGGEQQRSIMVVKFSFIYFLIVV